MTREQVRQMIEYLHNKSKSHKQGVFEAVRVLGNPSVHQIKELLDDKARREVDKLYKLDQVSNNQREREVKNRTMDKRTIHRKLADLTKEGLVEHKNNRYSISEKAKSDIRYHPDLIGHSVLNNLMRDYDLSGNDKNDLKELIKRFGTYMVYCFIEAARPIIDENNSMTAAEKDDIVSLWLESVLSPMKIYDFFIISVDPRLQYFEVKKDGNQVYDYESARPWYKLDSQTADRYTKAFKKLYPDLYNLY